MRASLSESFLYINFKINSCSIFCRYVSMDENMLRFDVQRQYRQLEQAYQSGDMSSSLPTGINRRLMSRASQPNFHNDRAQTDSPYAIPGLPQELQARY